MIIIIRNNNNNNNNKIKNNSFLLSGPGLWIFLMCPCISVINFNKEI